jgi:hypothetical protein
MKSERGKLMESIQITVKSNERRPFKHFYNAVGYANVDYTYTEPSLRMYDYLSSFNNHYKYMRLHNILTAHGKGDYYLLNHGMDYGNPPDNGKYSQGGDGVVSIDAKGNLKFNWEIVDKVYDILIEHNIKPIVETVFMPSCLQKSTELWFTPKDYNLWGKVIREFTIHLQDRYGKEEVETWYFEIWNEPDNHKEWVEDCRNFLALYDYMERAIHGVNPNLKVGGPAVKQGEGAEKIFRAFLEHCSNGLNYATGKFGTRLDFISVHCKGGWPNAYNPSTEVMFNSVRRYLDIIKEYPEFEGTEFFNDESDIVWNGNQGIWVESWLNFRNTHYFPGFVCKMVNTYCNIVEDQYNMNLSIVDSDNCHLQWERYLFSGNRSQFTPLNKYPSTDIVKKPSFNAYVLLSKLGKERMAVECSNKDFGRKFGVLPSIEYDVLSIMVWNFEDGMDDDVNDRNIEVNIKDLDLKGRYKLVHYRIDKEHSSSYNAWKKLGKPDNPTVEEIMAVRAKEGLDSIEDVKTMELRDELKLSLIMPMHSVSLLLLVPENSSKPETPTWIKACSEEGFNENKQVFLKWKPNSEKDFLYYRIWRKDKAEDKYVLISDNKSVNTSTFIDMDVKQGNSYFYKVQAINASMIESDLSGEIIVEGEI